MFCLHRTLDCRWALNRYIRNIVIDGPLFDNVVGYDEEVEVWLNSQGDFDMSVLMAANINFRFRWPGQTLDNHARLLGTRFGRVFFRVKRSNFGEGCVQSLRQCLFDHYVKNADLPVGQRGTYYDAKQTLM